MIESILSYLNTLSGNTPVIAGVISLSITGAIGFVVWKLPLYLLKLLKNNFTTTFIINNAGYGGNIEQYMSFLRWFSSCPDLKKWSRTIGFEGGRNWDEGYMGPSLGIHFFIFKRRLYWCFIKELPSTGSEKEKRSISISSYGTDLKTLRDLFKNFMFKPEDELNIKEFIDRQWQKTSNLPKRNWDTIILKEDFKNSISNTITEFLTQKQWYLSRGIPYKLVILLYGETGTGKTSLIKALAYKFKRDVAVLKLHSMSDSSLPLAISKVDKNAIIAIEDFDTTEATKSRTKESNSLGFLSEDIGLNLSTILNTLDGLAELDGQIIIMTTNHLEKLDTALIRSARVDLLLEVKRLHLKEVQEYCRLAYPDITLDIPLDVSITGCKLQELSLKYKNKPLDFVKELYNYKEKLNA